MKPYFNLLLTKFVILGFWGKKRQKRLEIKDKNRYFKNRHCN